MDDLIDEDQEKKNVSPSPMKLNFGALIGQEESESRFKESENMSDFELTRISAFS